MNEVFRIITLCLLGLILGLFIGDYLFGTSKSTVPYQECSEPNTWEV